MVFSNMFSIRVLSNKVDSIKILNPFNILLFFSLFLSLLIIVTASLVSYSVQEYSLESATFIQSVDCIIVVVLNVIATVLVLRRK
jgi:hypothetical protein